MKGLICALSVLAILVLSSGPAHAASKGSMQRDVWSLELDNTAVDATTMTVYYMGKRLQVVSLITVPGGVQGFSQSMPKPGKGIRRVIIDVDPPDNGRVTARINQGAIVAVSEDLGSVAGGPGQSYRLVFDVAGPP